MTTDSIVAEVLDRAAELIEPDGAWIQHAHALNADGEPAEHAADAVCYCVLGAISVASGADPEDEAGASAHKILFSIIDDSIPEWNDAPDRTQAEVVAKLREAAALARAHD